MKDFPFLPMFSEELKAKGWDALDVLLITGDPYVDHPAYGTALIGRVLEREGYRVGIIAQPDWRSLNDFVRLGKPELAVCITAGNVDSMVANYTANKRRRHGDDDVLGERPDRASIVYATRVRQAFKGVPVILGGVEASMRRLAHYDYWDDALRRSVLMDTKADLLIYGMGERPLLEVLTRLRKGEAISSIRNVRGSVVRVKQVDVPAEALVLPSFEKVSADKDAFNLAFRMAYHETSPADAKTLAQAHADQIVLQLPPALPMTSQELDASYDLPYTRQAHPVYLKHGGVKGLETVRWSMTALRGCPGECSFCGIAMHQGRIVQSRSPESIKREVIKFTKSKDFHGTINDVGGPTANLYGAQCVNWGRGKACQDKQCLMPEKCPSLKIGSAQALKLYEMICSQPGVKHMFIQSGLRYDLLMEPEAREYFKRLCERHISGQMKVAPEHTSDDVLKLMNKPSHQKYVDFVDEFEKINACLQKRVYLVNYFVSAHPGAGLKEAFDSAMTLLSCGMHPEQVQDFLPLPMTVSAAMYYTGKHPLTGKPVHVPKADNERAMQRALVQSQNPKSAPLIHKALHLLGKENQAGQFGVVAGPRAGHLMGPCARHGIGKGRTQGAARTSE
ncbi:MAG: YgiQ family radical SAM protein [Candidatus Omnitrophota bacterium]